MLMTNYFSIKTLAGEEGFIPILLSHINGNLNKALFDLLSPL